MKETILIRFLKSECANYDSHYDCCLSADVSCNVLEGKRCKYFEKAVLGPSDYKYRLPGWDYTRLFAEYTELTGAKTKKIQQRKCKCGEVLQYRQRFCEKCQRLKAKQANKIRQKKYRNKNRNPDYINVTL